MTGAAQSSSAVQAVHVDSDLTVGRCRALWDRIRAASERSETEVVRVDLAEAGTMDTAGAVMLAVASDTLAARGQALELDGLREQHQQSLELVRLPAEDDDEGDVAPDRGPDYVAPLRKARGHVRGFASLVARTALCAVQRPPTAARTAFGGVVAQSVRMGVRATPLVCALSFLLGFVLAFQSLFQLRTFGADIFTVDIVGVGMVRELGPVLVGIVLAGRSSTGIAAELGTMATREEIDALRTMGLDPVRLLVLPRVLGLLLVQPVLTLFGSAAGVFGGLVLGRSFGLSPTVFFSRLQTVLGADDVASCLGKAVVFGAIVAFSGAYAGFSVRGGARAVGQATTAAVVSAIALIVSADCVITAFLLGVGDA